MRPCAISQPPLAAPMAWPAYIAELLSAIEAEASVGAMPARRACCAELDAKQPSPQGRMIRATSSTLVASGHSSRLKAMAPTLHITARGAPVRSILRDISTLPVKPKNPYQANKRLRSVGLNCSCCLKYGAK